MSTAEFLIDEANSRCVSMAYGDLPAFAGTYSPPQDVSGNPLTDFSTFSQQVTIEYVSESDFTVIVNPGPTDFTRITVTILMNGNEISSANWIRANMN